MHFLFSPLYMQVTNNKIWVTDQGMLSTDSKQIGGEKKDMCASIIGHYKWMLTDEKIYT